MISDEHPGLIRKRNAAAFAVNNIINLASKIS